MKIIKIDFKRPVKTEVDLIVDYFKRGKIVVYPTDTIYGIGCIATDKRAIDRIYKIKKRDKEKSLLVLVSSLAMAKRYCYVSRKQEEYLRRVWRITSSSVIKNPPSPPLLKGGRPVSVILKSKEVLSKELAGGGDSLAVRLPNNELLVKMIRQVNAPIVSTSLNISGRKNLTNVSKIERYLKKSPNPPQSPQPPLSRGRPQGGNQSPQPLNTRARGNNNKELPDLVVDVGEIKGKPSKLIDLTDINNIKILRK